MRKISVSLFLSVFILITVFGICTFAENVPVENDFGEVLGADVTLTVTPSVNEVEASSEGADVTYTITLTPAAGKNVGYFEFKLKPSAGIMVNSATTNSDLLYIENVLPNGVFETNKYTPETMYLLCAGTTTERNLANEAVVLTVNATIDVSTAGTYTLGLVGARAAFDGSAAPYDVKVVPGVVKVRELEKMDSKKRAQDAIVMKVDTSLACAFGKMIPIDSENEKVVPYIYNDRTLVPLRFVSESLGAEVIWEDGWNHCSINKEGKQIKITFNSADIEVDGKTVTYDAPVQVVEGRTMVPIRFISEELGYHVHWNAPNKMVVITPADNPWVAEREAENTLIREVVVTLFLKGSF